MPSPFPSAHYPDLSRAWHTMANVELPLWDTLDNMRKAKAWSFKQAMINPVEFVAQYGGEFGANGPPPNPWVMEYSCDGVTAGVPGDGVDRWGASLFDPAKIVHSTTARSWFVASHANAEPDGGTVYVCVDLPTVSKQTITVIFSRSPFTGGTTSARPTSPDEWVCMSNQSICQESSANRHRVFIVMDEIGNFYWLMGRHTSGVFNVFVSMTHLQDYKEGDTATMVVTNNVGSAGAPTNNTNYTSGGTQMRSFDRSSTAVTAGLCAWTFGSFSLTGHNYGPNGIDAKWEVLPVLIAVGTNGRGGVRGRLPDMYCGAWRNHGTGWPGPGEPRKWTSVGTGWLIPMNVNPIL